ncbi:DNA cytosine methyltransferase [Shewanella colwelliana]|uniref:DNA cytosine methyltransferase n=1 Tax=Shewanella colwelliana TaxID=23 RepID=UPI0022AF317E|nr:DNA cytosine methyltransferase [Shewanella colwelliana]MCZ4337624.1 DNA cytosine methyltransferase [Shewanella colwelliana]
MVTVTKIYSVKQFANGVARIYINDTQLLDRIGLKARTPIRVEYHEHGIRVVPDHQGTKSVMDSGRGALLELRNKETYKSVGDVDSVAVKFTSKGVKIGLRYTDKQRLKREASMLKSLAERKPIRTASLFSGIGLLTLFLKNGLKAAGIDSQITLANDSCPKAMDANLAGNPVWDDAAEDAQAIIDSIDNIDLSNINEADLVEIGYPCIALSKLCQQQYRDVKHPVVGHLFIKVIEVLRKLNPAMMVFENVTTFVNSETFRFITSELKDYRFESVILNGHDFGGIEGRPRACVIAVSKGLPVTQISTLKPPVEINHPPLSHFLEPMSLSSPVWKEMLHVKRKADNPKLNFKNCAYHGHETLIATITATYASPKAGAPMVLHPTTPSLQRQLTEREHAHIRQLPPRLFNAVMDIANGISSVVSRRGSVSAVHRMLGNSVSKCWEFVGEHLGNYLSQFTLDAQQAA